MNSIKNNAPEIGSEFWNIPIADTKNNIFPEDTRWFLSGRTALRAILKDIKKKRACHTAALPSWCCDSMIEPFLDEGFDVSFYPVYWANDKLHVVLDLTRKSDVTLVLDYFGYAHSIGEKTHSQGLIIRDVTHSLFSKMHNDADYYFGSLRKWAGFYTGGFAWTDHEWTEHSSYVFDPIYVNMRESAMKAKSLYIVGQSSDKQYLSMFEKAEEHLDNYKDICSACPDDIRSALFVDVTYIKKRRRENATILLDGLREYTIFKNLQEDDCPMFVPILVEDRNALRRFLIQHEIYCPVHWPVSENHSLTEKERYIYDRELSLVCDQRYDRADMLRVLEVIRKFFNAKRT